MDEADIATGEALVGVLASFVESLASRGLAPRTIRRHVDNLWLLGGEIISKINVFPDERQKTVWELLDTWVDDEGGPLSTHLQSDGDRKSFDSTCRKLHAFLKARKGI